MGSAALFHLARAGRRVLGFDRFRPPHEFGSTHGLSRIIREAYFEHPAYVPLVQRAYELWAELERQSGRRLLVQTGGLMIGPRTGALVTGARTSAEKHKLAYELLSAGQAQERFPALQPEQGMVAIAEPRAGILFPEIAVQTNLELAAQYGATVRLDEPVMRWEANGRGVDVSTMQGRYRADSLVLSAGPWATTLLRDLHLGLITERQVQLWFEPKAHPEWFTPAKLPIFICEYAAGKFFYGFPNLGDGVKVALHHQGQSQDPQIPSPEVCAQDIEHVRELLRRFLPCSDGELKTAATCIYTNAPDEHFVFGRHPAHPQVIIVSPCSGHGFKFSPVIGEMAAAMVAGANIPFDLSLFNPARFAASA